MFTCVLRICIHTKQDEDQVGEYKFTGQCNELVIYFCMTNKNNN